MPIFPLEIHWQMQKGTAFDMIKVDTKTGIIIASGLVFAALAGMVITKKILSSQLPCAGEAGAQTTSYSSAGKEISKVENAVLVNEKPSRIGSHSSGEISDQQLQILYKNMINKKVKSLWEKKMELFLKQKDPKLLSQYQSLKMEFVKAEGKAILVEKRGEKDLNILKIKYRSKIKVLLGPKIHKEYVNLQKDFNKSIIRMNYVPVVHL